VIGGPKMKSYLMEIDIAQLMLRKLVMHAVSETNSLIVGDGLALNSVE
jgi:hypothetical protein